MNTITEIENALKAINDARFQNLVTHLLHLQGNRFIGAPGAVVGKEKTSRGTPDSFFVNEGKYIFVECTTQERLGESKTFFEKLSKDIDHCFDEKKTHISNKDIEMVILACNEKISVKEYKSLSDKVKSYNPNATFDLLNIQNLSFFIYDSGKLAEEYLDIQIIKGDIFKLPEFLDKTTKGLQPSLTNEFVGREEELQRGIAALKRSNRLILTGGAGVGKSKLAVKILDELSKEGYIPIVIQSSAVSLWDDYKHMFLPGKQYIILFDDANKSIANLNYLLSKLETARSYSAKLIVTSRDYVKSQVLSALDNYAYEEMPLSKLKDESIENVIKKAQPNLKYHTRKKIVGLAKGNARIALMAAYSVTPNSKTNYLATPVLLYEKYFKKVSEEIGILDNPIALKALAIVSFFGVLDRNNEQLKTILSVGFSIDWGELWSTIMELHNHEVLDIYSNEVVKVSDQVLATYAFYKCFIDQKSSVINYGRWIIAFMEGFAHRLRVTLIDVNNTFDYKYIKELVTPHLDHVLQEVNSSEQLYSFYSLFWFYKRRKCLLYLKKWMEGLEHEEMPETLKFSYRHNDHVRPSKNFELLKGFWDHWDELLKPSLELTLDLLVKQPSRLPEILKFIHDDFKYKLLDRDYGYVRQNILLDVLLDDNLSEQKKTFSDGIFHNLVEVLLGWHYTDHGSSGGATFTIVNFDLYKSDALMKLRSRILEQIYKLYDPRDEQHTKILNRIVSPGAKIDQDIYVEELPIYEKVIGEKLDKIHYSHCLFVKKMAKHFTEVGASYPKSWNDFIESDVMQLSEFLKPGWEHRNDKTIQDLHKETIEKYDQFIKSNTWKTIEKFLYAVDDLYKQQTDNSTWFVEGAINDIYLSIAKKSKKEFVKALRIFFSGEVHFPLRATITAFVLESDIMTGKELLSIMNEYEFIGKPQWKTVLLAILPKKQVNGLFLNLLLEAFQDAQSNIYPYRMLDYLKFDKIFEKYKREDPKLKNHNIITYLTTIMLPKSRRTPHDFGTDFFVDCASYFTEQMHLLKEVYLLQYNIDQHFDYNGQQLKAILSLDKRFINESLKDGTIGLEYTSELRLENINTSALWEFDEYEEILEDILLIILNRVEYTSLVEHDIHSLFKFERADENRMKKVQSFILNITFKYLNNREMVNSLMMVVYDNYRGWFIDYFRAFLLLNKDVEFVKDINFSRSESWSGSRVPIIQKKIDFYQNIIDMIVTLPGILDYSDHIDYFEQKISWKKIEIQDEQRQDFMEELF